MSTDDPTEKALTQREKLALWCLFVILKVVKPMRWDGDYKEELAKLKTLLGE
jgi:hypothetical protein